MKTIIFIVVSSFVNVRISVSSNQHSKEIGIYFYITHVMKTSRKNLFKTTKMKNKHLSLSNVYKDLNDACIVITPSSTVSLNSYSKILLYRFMSLLNSLIGAQTNINYHIERVQNFTIVIPIYQIGRAHV